MRGYGGIPDKWTCSFVGRRSETQHADMAELADAPDLGSGVHDVQVQVLLSARKTLKALIFQEL